MTVNELIRMPLFNPNAPNRSTAIIGGECSGILNWNDISYPQMYTYYQTLLSNFWKASEINMEQDVKQWAQLADKEQQAFKHIIGLLAALDSIQTPLMTIVSDYLSDSSLKAIVGVISQQEAVHNESYSYILSSIVELQEQNDTFNQARDHEMIRKRNRPIMLTYERFRGEPTKQHLFEVLVNSIVLEGIYFYAGFAFFYNLARDQKMVSTSTMISYIHRDELQHCYFVSQLIRILFSEFPELHTEKNVQYIYDTLTNAVELEQEWSHHILDNIEGIDLDEFENYIEYLANKRLRQLGLSDYYKNREENVMPWIKAFNDTSINNTKTDFFEQKSRTYTKIKSTNRFDDL